MRRFAAGAVGQLVLVAAVWAAARIGQADRSDPPEPPAAVGDSPAPGPGPARVPPSPPPSLVVPPEEVARARGLVRRLGGLIFRDRDQAARDLRRMGRLAVAALTEGAADPDPEVRSRCEGLLPAAEADDTAARAAAFLADPDGPHGMPGWAEFEAAAGDDAAARDLFAAIAKDPVNHPLLRAIGRPDGWLPGAVAARRGRVPRRDTAQRLKPGTNEGERPAPLELPEAAVLLLAEVAHPGQVGPPVPLFDRLGWGVYSFSTPAQEAVAGRGPHGPAFRRLVFRWVDTRDEWAAAELMRFLAHNQVRNEMVVRLAARVLALGHDPANTARAVSYLVGYGGKDHLPAVVGRFADARVAEHGRPNTRTADDIEVRDVALLVALELTGQDPKAYGFEPSPINNPFGCVISNPLRFRPTGPEADKKRAAAFKKWDAWAAEHRSP